jgi:hypothetical protein
MKIKSKKIPAALVLLFLQLFHPFATHAQNAFSASGVEFPILRNGSAAWGDFDNDGNLDLVVTGFTNVLPYISEIWRNNGDSTFSRFPADLGPHAQGAVAWADLNNDGFLDLILTGKTNPPAADYSTEIWRNQSGTNFVRVPNNLPAGSLGSITTGDFDNDGRLDVVLNGSEGATSNAVFRNLGNFAFTDNGMPQFSNPGIGFSQFADMDNDGWLDLFVDGDPDSFEAGGPFARLYRNLNGVGLTNTASLPGAGYARGEIGDYNHDGHLDLLTASTLGSDTNAHVWFNNGLEFLESGNEFPPSSFGGGTAEASWGDYDNDGFSDVFLLWRSQVARVFRNTGGGIFTNINANFPNPDGTTDSQIGEWGDFDDDGKLDLLMSVSLVNYPGNAYRLYRNNTLVSNTPPTAPSGLTYELSQNGTNVTLRWMGASDAQTPEGGLTYNVRVGTTPGGCDVISPMADAITGKRRIPALGNAQMRHFTLLRNLEFGRTYYWGVQAVDTAFAGGAWASEASFTTRIPTSGDLDNDGVVSRTEFDIVLENYLANSPYLRITNTAGLGGTNVTFALTNDIAGALSVEYSTNLTDWQLLGPATPRYLFSDPDATNSPQRSYRLRWP